MTKNNIAEKKDPQRDESFFIYRRLYWKKAAETKPSPIMRCDGDAPTGDVSVYVQCTCVEKHWFVGISGIIGSQNANLSMQDDLHICSAFTYPSF